MAVGMKSPIMAIQTTPPPLLDHSRRLIAFTTPENYAARLSQLLRLKNWDPLWCPTVLVQTTPQTKSSLLLHLFPPNPKPKLNNKSSLESFSAIAFTSRTGISAFSQALETADKPLLLPYGDVFTISALGKDSELLNDYFIDGICVNRERIRVLVPKISTPGGIVAALGFGGGRRVLCPVPLVVGLEEPLVVPNFLQELESNGWVPVRVDGYETRWAGRECAAEVVARLVGGGDRCVDAVIFTSSAEVEGMLKSLGEYGLDWGMVKERWPEMVVAAHGPVTAAGAERLGVGADVNGTSDGSEGKCSLIVIKLARHFITAVVVGNGTVAVVVNGSGGMPSVDRRWGFSGTEAVVVQRWTWLEVGLGLVAYSRVGAEMF